MDSFVGFAAPLDTPVSVVIAGGGLISNALLADLMDDWIRFGTPDQVDARVWLPADKEFVGEAVEAAAAWAGMEGRPGNSVVVAGFDNPVPTQRIYVCGDGSFEVSAEEAGSDVATTLITALEEDNREEQRLPFLILAWGEGEDAPDEFSEKLLTAATEAGIPVLEISARGLEVFGREEETVDEPQAEPVADEAQSVIEPAAGPIAQPVAEPQPTAEPAAPFGLMQTLRRCEMLVEAHVMTHEALHDTAAEPDLLKAIRYFQQRVRSQGPAAVLEPDDDTPRVEVTTITPEPVAESPVRKGRSRTAAGQIAVFLSPEGVKAVEKGFQPGAEEVTLAVGRPRTNWVRRSVEKDLVPASLLAV